MKSKFFLPIITIVFCSFIFIPRIESVIQYSNNFVSTLTVIFSNLDKNAQERLLMKHTTTFSIVNFIQEKTSENSTIVIPGKIPHGNPGHLISIPSNAYALMFPRKIVSNKDFSSSSSNSNTYLIFLESFPEEIVSYEKIWYVLDGQILEHKELEDKNKIQEGIIKL